jgi:hypothetical protein
MLNEKEIRLRDHFAGLAMLGILHASSLISFHEANGIYVRISDISKKSFDLADAMLAEALRREGEA